MKVCWYVWLAIRFKIMTSCLWVFSARYTCLYSLSRNSYLISTTISIAYICIINTTSKCAVIARIHAYTRIMRGSNRVGISSHEKCLQWNRLHVWWWRKVPWQWKLNMAAILRFDKIFIFDKILSTCWSQHAWKSAFRLGQQVQIFKIIKIMTRSYRIWIESQNRRHIYFSLSRHFSLPSYMKPIPLEALFVPAPSSAWYAHFNARIRGPLQLQVRMYAGFIAHNLL